MKTSQIIINGQQYTLQYDFNKLVDVETASNYNLLAVINHLDLAGAGQFRAVLFALLLHHHPAMTLEEAGALCTPESLPKLARAIADLFPEPESENEKPKLEAAAAE